MGCWGPTGDKGDRSLGHFGQSFGMSGSILGGHVASGRFERNWGPTEFKEGNLIKSANSSRRGSGGHWRFG